MMIHQIIQAAQEWADSADRCGEDYIGAPAHEAIVLLKQAEARYEDPETGALGDY